ncbi:MAG: ribosome maturation factor RimP [Pseudomonadales bacterium]
MNTREQNIEVLLTPVVEALGCELWGIEFAAQGRHSRLRVYIERAEERVTVEDCERVSRAVSDVLDVEDVISSAYTLEVSSPGMDRILFKPAHYGRNVGAIVDVRLHYPFEGSKRIVGVLAGIENDEVLVQVEDQEYVLPVENIQRARLVPQFDVGRSEQGTKLL